MIQGGRRLLFMQVADSVHYPLCGLKVGDIDVAFVVNALEICITPRRMNGLEYIHIYFGSSRIHWSLYLSIKLLAC